jgi:hypothetical protein
MAAVPRLAGPRHRPIRDDDAIWYDGNFIVFAGLQAGSHPTGRVAHPRS